MNAWPIIQEWMQSGALTHVDLAFAKMLLKTHPDAGEAQAAFLCLLFANARKGHLALDLNSEHLQAFLKELGFNETQQPAALVLQGASTLPLQTLQPWIHIEKGRVYLQKNWADETAIVQHLQRLLSATPAIPLSNAEPNPVLNPEQQAAVMNGLRCSLSLLTGGPGTGKTFTAAQLVLACLAAFPLEQRNAFRVQIAAPTGKAVAQLEKSLRKQLSSHPCIKASTLHALLNVRAADRDEPCTAIAADLILVDESSMIDVALFARLLASVPSGARLVLIGDKDQLPPVEAGSVFADILESGACPCIELVTCRRSDSPEILAFARQVKEGALSDELPLELITLGQTPAQLWHAYRGRFPSFTECEPDPQEILSQSTSFCLLSCVRQGPLGVDAVNQHFLFQFLKEAPKQGWWAAPILVTRNDYDLELYNGDIGILVRKMGPDFSMRNFSLDDYAIFPDRDGGVRKIAALALSAFEYSYCLSVHKSQGSEYDEVVVLLPPGSEVFGREVLYTAVTRARKRAALAAEPELIQQALQHSSRKISGLPARLKR